MGIISTISVLAAGLRLAADAYKKVFKGTLTTSLKELSEVSGEYDQIAKCLLETLKTGSIRIESLPDKDEECLNEIVMKIKDSHHFRTFCQRSTYPDHKLRKAVASFLEIFERHAAKNQELAHQLQLQYHKRTFQSQRKMETDVRELKQRMSVSGRPPEGRATAVTSQEDVEAPKPLDPNSYKFKYLGALFARAHGLGERRQFTKALYTYRKFLKEKGSNSHPKYYVVLNNMAVAYSELRKYHRALEYAQKAHQVAPRRSLAVVNLGVAFFYLGKLDEALVYAEKAASRRKNDPKVYSNLSIIWAEKGNHRKAEQFINQALRKGKNFAPAYVNRALLHAHAGKFDEALKDARTATELEPQNGQLFVYLGMVYQQKLFSLAEPKVVRLGDKAQVYYIPTERIDGLIVEYRDLLETARQSYEKALSLGVQIAENPTLGLNLAECYFMVKEYEKAQGVYNQIKVEDERDYPYQGLGDAYFWAGRSRKALACYRRFIKLHGENPHVYNMMARTLSELGKSVEAIVNLKHAIRLQPEDSRYKFNLALLYERMGRFRDAQEKFEELAQVGLHLPEVHYHLGKLYFSQGMYASAKLELQKAKKAGSLGEAYSQLLAVSAAQSNDRTMAKVEFADLLSVNPDSFEYNLNYAQILHREGKVHHAKKHYFKSLMSKEINEAPEFSLFIQEKLCAIDKAMSASLTSATVAGKTTVAQLVIKKARQLVTLHSTLEGPRVRRIMDDMGIIEDGAVAVSNGKIVAVGYTDQVLGKVQVNEETKVIDATDKVVLPGFVDCHTHPVFAATREEEFEMRVKGRSYQEIAAAGGGIKSSVRTLRAASKQELIQLTLPRLDRMISYGTTTVEAKSGYGLSLDDEIKMLEVIKELNHLHPIDLTPTFLGAHEIPEEYKDRRKEYIQLIVEKIIPEVARRKLAVFCDIFCEKGVFDIEESRKILTAAKDHGFKLKLHADQLTALGGSKLAAELGAVSADHLEFIDDEGIEMMKQTGVIGVLLPGACFGLGMKEYPPARKMIDQGLPVALATDFNPGSSMTESMPIILSMACLMMKMSPAEAVVASTINSAYAVGRADDVGSIEVGKKADLVIWNVQDYREIPYHYGVNLVDQVIKDGKIL